MGTDTQKIVRVARRDLPGELPLEDALRGIRGISFMMARAITQRLDFPTNQKLGDLSDVDLKKIEEKLDNPHQFKFPSWMLNRRKDRESGMDTHLVETSLMLSHRSDLDRMKKLKSYRGIRHMFGLPVRGQRTRSTGRKNKTVGVQRKGKGGTT